MLPAFFPSKVELLETAGLSVDMTFIPSCLEIPVHACSSWSDSHYWDIQLPWVSFPCSMFIQFSSFFPSGNSDAASGISMRSL